MSLHVLLVSPSSSSSSTSSTVPYLPSCPRLSRQERLPYHSTASAPPPVWLSPPSTHAPTPQPVPPVAFARPWPGSDYQSNRPCRPLALHFQPRARGCAAAPAALRQCFARPSASLGRWRVVAARRLWLLVCVRRAIFVVVRI
jgi:hypothetical protein